MAAGNGAQVTNSSGCQTLPNATVCGTLHTETHNTSTPSGNTNIQANGKYDLTVTFTSGYSYSYSGSFHEHFLYKQGQPQEFSLHNSDTYTTSLYGTCTTSWDLHYANGKYQFDNITEVCIP